MSDAGSRWFSRSRLRIGSLRRRRVMGYSLVSIPGRKGETLTVGPTPGYQVTFRIVRDSRTVPRGARLIRFHVQTGKIASYGGRLGAYRLRGRMEIR